MNEGPIVAIHQPNLFPWLGWFDKFARSDRFIMLDHVQFPKTGGTWTNRTRVLVEGAPKWLTVPIRRNYSGLRPINDIEIDYSSPWQKKFESTLQGQYARAPFFNSVFPMIRDLLADPGSLLAEWNVRCLLAMVRSVGLTEEKVCRSSNLDVTGDSTAMLIDIVKKVGGTSYLSGDGAKAYQDENLFEESRITLVYQNFRHPTYPQIGGNEFVAGLSICDALFNCGFEGVKEMLRTFSE